MDIIIAVAPPIITGLVSLLVCIITQSAANKKNAEMLEYRLAQLEKKVDKHNNLVERMYKVEERTELQEEKIRVANHRLDDLEHAHA